MVSQSSFQRAQKAALLLGITILVYLFVGSVSRVVVYYITGMRAGEFMRFPRVEEKNMYSRERDMITERLENDQFEERDQRELEQRLMQVASKVGLLEKESGSHIQKWRLLLNMQYGIMCSTLILLGLLFMILGYFLTLDVVSIGFLLGGLISFVVGSLSYWYRNVPSLRDYGLLAVPIVGILIVASLLYQLLNQKKSE